MRVELPDPPSAQSPFARRRRYPPSGRPRKPPQRTLLLLPRSYGLMRQTKSLPAPRWSLGHQIFAGCRQSLLGDGPSRHYLCNPCIGAWTHTPPRSSDAFAHSFSEDTGLTPRETRSARETSPAMQLPQGAVFRGCSHSFTFRLLRSLGLQVAPTAAPLSAGQPGRLHHASPGWLPIPGCGIATCPT